ncbi:MAG: YebC/PmpR family DNA-binding transcriptional regulator [Candidatus Magasanikbacteria bacterium]|nr:YebC/PmpR family DNA-binding transcriptional regulator [Candidatus Magasanikbacteria bacterium]
MSGHSKWHNIQGRKGKQDAKRSSMFSKFSKAITIAAQRGGGDPETNFVLRIAIDKSKSVSMPKDNIERAIKKGTGADGSAQIEEVYYEAFGPGGTAVIIKCLTDNKNRTVADVKHILTKNGGTMSGNGSVMWMFEQLGVIQFETSKLPADKDNFELAIIEAGADDISIDGEQVEIKTKVENFGKVLNKLKDLGIEADDSALRYVAKEEMAIGEATREQIIKLFELLEENDDVDDYYTNAG